MTNHDEGAQTPRKRRRRRRSTGQASPRPGAGKDSAASHGGERGSDRSPERGSEHKPERASERNADKQPNAARKGSGRGRRGTGRKSGAASGGAAGAPGRSGARSAGSRSASSRGPQRTSRRPVSAQARAAAASRMVTRDETSAGGLVISGLAESVQSDGSVDLSQIYVALIGRLDRRGRLLWSMPKGHVEEGEAKDLTAEREVWEETGIYGKVIAELGVIDYWFVSDGVRIHKTVHHHLLRYVDGVLNDEDPEVTEVAWIPVSELIEHLAYADERKLARVAHNLIPDAARAEAAAGKITPR